MKNISISKIILIITLILVGIALLLIMLFNIKIYRINGTSMSPTLQEKEYVLTYKTNYKRGDIIAYSHNNVIMIKRIIGLPQDKVDIKEDGTVYINDVELQEPYLTEKALGDPEITFPYEVPANTYFVLGDNRADSLDSRNIHIGSINQEAIIGKVKLSLIPLKEIETQDY